MAQVLRLNIVQYRVITGYSMEITITNVTANPTDVTVTYNVTGSLDESGNPAVYTTNVSFVDAPNQTDITSQDNYAYYTSLITGA